MGIGYKRCREGITGGEKLPVGEAEINVQCVVGKKVVINAHVVRKMSKRFDVIFWCDLNKE